MTNDFPYAVCLIYLNLYIFLSSPGVIQQSPTGISLWMGGHDSVTEGGWEWTDGSPFRYIHWNAGTFKAKYTYTFTNTTYEDYCLAKPLNHWPRLSTQVTQTTTMVKTACLYLLTTATGMTTTVSSKEDTSASGEVRYVTWIGIVDTCKRKTMFWLLVHDGNTILHYVSSYRKYTQASSTSWW